MRFSASFLFLLIGLSLGVIDATPWDQLEKLYFGGRWWRDGDAMRHSWGTGTFIVRFRGSSSLVMKMGAALGGAYYTCQVDGGPEQRIPVSNDYQNADETGMTFTGLSTTEEHTIRCGRNNEASYGATVITDVVLESGGQLLQATDPNINNNMIRFEAIGDSITAGYKVYVTPGASDPASIANQDVFQTYIRFMADAWGTSDYQVIAKSGVSILDYGTTGIVMPMEWPCREYWAAWQGGCPGLWDFSSWQADVVTINLGTNDFAFGNPTQQQFRLGYLAFIRQVRDKYPNALIACIEPIQHSCSGESFPLLTGIVDGLEQAVNDMNDPKVIYYETGRTSDPWLDCTLSTQDFMDFTHPTVQGNQKFASRLLEEITDDVRRFFPEKCGGEGPTCGPGAPSAPVSSPVSSPVAPISSPIAPVTTPVASPVSSPTASELVCTSVPQSQLPSGVWAAAESYCKQCEDGYEWWPCDTTDPPLCDCSQSGPSPVSSPVAPPVDPPIAPIAPAPVAPTSPVDDHDGENSRMIAYLGNWQPCPTEAQIEQYSHIMIGFAVTYSWSPDKNICDSTCQISRPPVCNNQQNPELIEYWQSLGKKVILSFGGAGMGGSWPGDNNDCWEYCFGREADVVSQLTEIVNDMNFDGIDIDYEYFHEDNQNGSGFTKGEEARKFLKDVTLGLRSSLPDKEVTHAPMEPDVMPGRGYYDVLVEIADSLDFLMPQYYNGYVRSYTNFNGALEHFSHLADVVFDGDATKVVYGFCIRECGEFNLDGDQSAEVMGWLADSYPCNGGAFFWVANDDVDGDWSRKVNVAIDSNQCPSDPAPVGAPVAPPVAPPVDPIVDPTPSPTASPTRAPTRNPTNSPTRSPINIVSPIAPPVDPPPSGGCCSQDFKSCAQWCQDFNSCGSGSCSDMKWLPNGALADESCTARWGGCVGDAPACCEGLVCVQSSQYWSSCQVPEGASQ